MLASRGMQMPGDSELDQIEGLPFSIELKGAELRFFINVQKVARVVESEKLGLLPDEMAPFSALFDLEGIPVPVIPLADVLRGQAHEGLSDLAQGRMTKGSSRIIICHVMNHLVGLEVAKTRKVFRTPNAELKAPPTLFAGSGKHLISGMIRDKDGFLYMFDLEGFLADKTEAFSLVQGSETPKTRKMEGRSILVVEDSEVFVSLVKRILERHGAVIDIARNGKEAWEKVSARSIPYDIVFTDIEMPIMTGVELARLIKKSACPSRVIFHSAISNQALIDDIREHGLGDYLVKFDEQNIVKACQGLLK